MEANQSPAIVYTDGSTSVRPTKPNSGCSIVVTDNKHSSVWAGGMVVRTDGNNFVAELAAAAIAIKACPPLFPLKLCIDSKAAIGALTRGAVSERKRVRAAGRAWLNFCRDDFARKAHHIQIQHVASHTGLETPEQRGNHQADEYAKIFRNLGDQKGPVLYFTHSEESFVFVHKDKCIQGDVRSYLKSAVEQKMVEIWKEDAPRQAEFFGAHPTQIKKQARLVWHQAIEKGDGRAWLYFIFGICQWLPTQYRINRHRVASCRSCSSSSCCSSSSSSRVVAVVVVELVTRKE